MLDCGRIADAIGEYKTCADNERPCGQHDSHNNVSHGHILALAHCMPKPKVSGPGTPHPLGLRQLAQLSLPISVDPRSGGTTRRATARFQGSANTVSWPPSDV